MNAPSNDPSPTDSYVLITGASAGIGRALAFEFARRKRNLLLIALPGSGLEETILSIKSEYNVRVHGFTADLTEVEAPSRILAWCKENNFEVSALVNNAGFGNLESLEDTPTHLLSSMMSLNSAAVVMMTQLFIPELKKHKQSYIMNLGSLASFIPLPRKSVYTATKSFVYAFSYSLYFELKSQNIHVSCLCPGATLTERVRESMSQQQIKHRNFCQLPEEVAQEAIRNLYAKKFRIIPGWKNRVLYWMSRILPRFVKIALIKIAFGHDKEAQPASAYPSFMRAFALLNR